MPAACMGIGDLENRFAEICIADHGRRGASSDPNTEVRVLARPVAGLSRDWT